MRVPPDGGGATASGGAGRPRAVANHPGRCTWREVERAASAEPLQLPVPWHPCGLCPVVLPTQCLTVGEGRPAAPAVRLDVIRFQSDRLLAAPAEPTVVLAASTGAGHDGRLVGPGERAHSVPCMQTVDGASGHTNACPRRED